MSKEGHACTSYQGDNSPVNKTKHQVALVVGVTGIAGLSLSQRLIKEGWTVYGISRRHISHIPHEICHLAVDLTDNASCREVLKDVIDVTHVFYATWTNRFSEEENCKVCLQ